MPARPELLTFGDLDDPKSEVSRIIKEKKAFQFHIEYGTEPSVYYYWMGKSVTLRLIRLRVRCKLLHICSY
jgi:Fe-S-cluster-containing dehydrogenase component